jgi:hypothetical protein
MVSIRATTRLKSDHIENAERFRDEARRIEELYSASDPDDGPIPDEDTDRHRAFCMNSIISTACFLEATINSFYWDLQDDCKRILEGNDPIHYPDSVDYRTAVCKAEHEKSGDERLSKRRENAGIIGQYNIFLDITGNEEFEKNEVPLEPVVRVLDIRNELVHFEPRWIQGGGKEYTESEYGFEETLKGRFELNPLMPSGNAFFPGQCLSHGCAAWAARVSRGFVHHFSKRIDLQIHPDIHLPW